VLENLIGRYRGDSRRSTPARSGRPRRAPRRRRSKKLVIDNLTNDVGVIRRRWTKTKCGSAANQKSRFRCAARCSDGIRRLRASGRRRFPRRQVGPARGSPVHPRAAGARQAVPWAFSPQKCSDSAMGDLLLRAGRSGIRLHRLHSRDSPSPISAAGAQVKHRWSTCRTARKRHDKAVEACDPRHRTYPNGDQDSDRVENTRRGLALQNLRDSKRRARGVGARW